MSERNLGPILDQLGVKTWLTDADHVTDVVVVLRIANTDDGETRIGISYSPGTDAVIRRGLIELGRDFEEMSGLEMIDMDDDCD